MENNTNSNCNKIVKLEELILRMFRDMEWKCILPLSILLVILIFIYSSCKVSICEQQRNQICQDFINVFSCVLGFTITGYAIILSSSNAIIEKMCRHTCKDNQNNKSQKEGEVLKEESSKEKVHYDILCASFTTSCVFIVFTIISAIIYKNKPVTEEWLAFFYIVIWLGIASFLLTLDLVFHLYTIASYRKKDNNDNKKQTSK